MNFRRKKCAARAASSVVSRLLTRAVVGTLILSFNGLALAGDTEDQIVERIGPLWPRAADVLALVASGAIVSRYFEGFNDSDALPDKDWNIVVERLAVLSERARVRVIPLAKERESEFQRNFVKALRRMPADDLTSLVTFLNSQAGTNWLLANRQFEQNLFQIGVRAGAYTAASPKRARSLMQANPPPDRGWRNDAPTFLMSEVLQGGARSTPAVFFLAQYLSILRHMDASKKVDAAYSLARTSAKEGRLSEHLFRRLAVALSTAISEGLADVTLQTIFNQSTAQEFENQISDLASRAFLAADPVAIGQCKYGGPAERAERGCDGKKDFVAAFREYSKQADQGIVSMYCKVANWYRHGIGTNVSVALAEKWEAKFREMANGEKCRPLLIDPRNPWAEVEQ